MHIYCWSLFPLLLLLILLLVCQDALSQDIVFKEPSDEQKGHYITRPEANGPDTAGVISIRFNGSSSFADNNNGKKCQSLCIPLDFCYELFQILERPSASGLEKLKRSSCGFTQDGDPKVWCVDAVCERRKLLLLERERGGGVMTQSQTQIERQLQELRRNLKNNNNPKKSSSSGTGSSVLKTPPLPVPQRIVHVQNSDEKQIENETQGTTLHEHRNGFVQNQNQNHTFHMQKPSLVAINDPECGLSFPSRISGGSAAVQGEFPWLTAISIMTSTGSQVICGGALISDQYVITAAHCVADSSHQIRNISHVRLGAHNITNPSEESAENVGVSKILFHPQFRERPVIKNDIALLKLKRPASIGPSIGTICLPEGTRKSAHYYETNRKGVIAGWGSDGSSQGFSLLQKVEIPLVDPNDCKRQFYRVRVRVLTDLQVCAGSKGRDSCKGDSGGPLMMRNSNTGQVILAGIISYGTIACDGRLPGVYTKVNAYIPWIHETIKNNSL